MYDRTIHRRHVLVLTLHTQSFQHTGHVHYTFIVSLSRHTQSPRDTSMDADGDDKNAYLTTSTTSTTPKTVTNDAYIIRIYNLSRVYNIQKRVTRWMAPEVLFFSLYLLCAYLNAGTRYNFFFRRVIAYFFSIHRPFCCCWSM